MFLKLKKNVKSTNLKILNLQKLNSKYFINYFTKKFLQHTKYSFFLKNTVIYNLLVIVILNLKLNKLYILFLKMAGNTKS